MPVDDIGFRPDIQAFPQIKKHLTRYTSKQVFEIDDRKAFETSLGGAFNAYGNITFRLQGRLEVDQNSYHFKGTLKAFDDIFDFNPSTHRPLVVEAITRGINWAAPGTPYDIRFTGQIDIERISKLP